jgi:hypothetical protein
MEAHFMTGQYQPGSGEELTPPWKKISDKWPEAPPQGHLHIFVTLPAAPHVQTGERFISLFALTQDI